MNIEGAIECILTRFCMFVHDRCVLCLHFCLQEYDCLMVDEINDVRIIGVITAVVMMAVALAGLSWESKVTRQFILLF